MNLYLYPRSTPKEIFLENWPEAVLSAGGPRLSRRMFLPKSMNLPQCMIERISQKIIIKTGAGNTLTTYPASRYCTLASVNLALRPYVPEDKKSPGLMLGNIALSERNWDIVTDQCNDVILDKSYGKDIVLTVGFVSDNFDVSHHDLFNCNHSYSVFSHGKYFFHYVIMHTSQKCVIRVFDCFKNQKICQKIYKLGYIRNSWTPNPMFNSYINHKCQTVVWTNISTKTKTKIISFTINDKSLIKSTKNFNTVTGAIEHSNSQCSVIGCGNYLYYRISKKTCNRLNIETGKVSTVFSLADSFWFIDFLSNDCIAIIIRKRQIIKFYNVKTNKFISSITLKKVIYSDSKFISKIDHKDVIIHNKVPYLSIVYGNPASLLVYTNMVTMQTNTVKFNCVIDFKTAVVYAGRDQGPSRFYCDILILVDFNNARAIIYETHEKACIYIRDKWYLMSVNGVVAIDSLPILAEYPLTF